MELDQMFSTKEIEVINDMCLFWLEKYFEYHEPWSCDTGVIHHTDVSMSETHFQQKFKDIDVKDLFDKLADNNFGKIREEELSQITIKDPGGIDMQIKDRKCFERLFDWNSKVLFKLINDLMKKLQK